VLLSEADCLITSAILTEKFFVYFLQGESIKENEKSALATTYNHNFGNQVLYTNGYKRLKLANLIQKRKMTTPDIR
jgi:hypothetical protein